MKLNKYSKKNEFSGYTEFAIELNDFLIASGINPMYY